MNAASYDIRNSRLASGCTFVIPAFVGTAEAQMRVSPVSIPSATGTPVNRPPPDFPTKPIDKTQIVC
ncbi:MAG: hypothetical protein KME26_20045 [Oscillatoria princeps RMCB-10]|nr:hypothetical protein [Oscillatoria princeps RMCB-10]